jgi:hypothetical protein
MWPALFCLVGLGPAIAIKVAAPPGSLVVERAQHQSEREPAFALNDSAKSDRRELPNARAETEIIVPAAKVMLAHTPNDQSRDSQEADRHWQNANARIISVASPRRRTKGTESKRRQIPAERKSRGLALPTGRRGQSFEVLGPLAKMQFVGRSDLLLVYGSSISASLNTPKSHYR